MRADNWREVIQNPKALPEDIRHYIEDENAYLQTVMADTEDLQKQLFEEIKGRIEEVYQSVPVVDGAYAYYYRYLADLQYPVFCRYASDHPNNEAILLDGNQQASQYDYFQIGELCQSPDHRFIAYSIDTEGSELYSIHINDTRENRTLTEVIPNVQGEIVWSNDSQYIFYIKLDDEHRPAEVYRHQLNTAITDDVLIYKEADKGFFISVSKTESKRFIVVSIHAHDTSECRILDAESPLSELRLIRDRQAKIEYDVEHHGSDLFIHTNIGGAEDYKIAYVKTDSPNDQWQDLYVPSQGVLLEDMLVLKDWLICYEYCNSLPRLNVFKINSDNTLEQDHIVAFEEECYAIEFEEDERYSGDVIRFSYSSMTTPESIYDYDMRKKEKTLLKQQVIPSGYTPSEYATRRVFATAPDGTLIPMSLFYAKASPPSADSPLLLYGYGAYGHIVSTRFSVSRLSLVNRGFVFAIAHIRGGMEKGYHWYRTGKLENKENTFKDFIVCAEHLCAEKFTSPNKLSIYGGSAGGMLIGAVLNMRPELFTAALADVPFVDVLTTMCDAELPLTPPEWDEWGNPIQKREVYQHIAQYSPYDNVAKHEYPHILVTAGISDPRVTYWEPAKWVAKLRTHKQGDNLLLLKTNMTAGHAGRSGRYDSLKEVALQYAFLLKVLNV